VRNLAGEANRQLRDRAEQETNRAGGALAQAGSQLQALAEGRVDEAGAFGEYAQQAAQAVNRWADSVQDRGLDGLLDDLRSAARRRPGAFLVGAVAAGVIAGRFGRNLREVRSDDAGNEPAGELPSRASMSSASANSALAPSNAPADPPTTPPPTTPPPPGRTMP
jgi:hypothetical protein